MASKAGPILGLIGGWLFIIESLMGLLLLIGGEGWSYIGFHGIYALIITFIWGIFIAVGAILALKGIKVGNIIMFSFGIVALIGTFIPIYYLEAPYVGFIGINYTMFYVDCILAILGGTVGFFSTRKD